jgi:hypothetical protein
LSRKTEITTPKPKTIEATNISENGKLAIKHLIGLKASKPRKLKTLKSTIHAKLGKDNSNSKVDEIIIELTKLKYLILDNQKVSYKFPAKLDI